MNQVEVFVFALLNGDPNWMELLIARFYFWIFFTGWAVKIIDIQAPYIFIYKYTNNKANGNNSDCILVCKLLRLKIIMLM